MMNLKQRQILSAHRKSLGFTQEEVATMLNMSLHQYQRYEYGEYNLANSSMRIGLRLCALLKVNPYKIVFNTDMAL